MAQETWAPIPGMAGYEASDQGRIRSFRRDPEGRILRTAKVGRGYLIVAPCINGQSVPRKVHHLVLFAFVGPRPPGMIGCHNNDVPDDNRASNLRWDTSESNIADRRSRGYRSDMLLRPEQALSIYQDPRRPYRIIAGEYGVSQETVRDIKFGRTWTPVTQHAPTRNATA